MSTTFESALRNYESAAVSTVNAHVAFKRAHADATLVAEGKNEAQRAAHADLVTISARLAYETARAIESSYRAQVDYLIAAAHGGTTVRKVEITVSSNQDPAAVAAAVKLELDKLEKAAAQ